MTVAGTVLGVGAFVATIGFAQTSALQVATRFDAVASTRAVVASVVEEGTDGETRPVMQLPWDAATRIERLSGVEEAALLSQIPVEDEQIAAVLVDDPSAPTLAQPRLFAASPDILDAVGASVVTGRMFDGGHDSRGDRVAVISARAAHGLRISDIASQPSIFIGGGAYAVIGIYDGVQYESDLVEAVVIPSGTGRSDFDLVSPDKVLAHLAVGGGPIVNTQAPITLSPDTPAAIDVAAPAGISTLREDIQSDINLVFLILSIVVLLAGGLGIANVTTLSVMERVGEIGLRRAVGSTPMQIAVHFITESVVIGTLGGLTGSALGVISIVVVAATRGWVPVADPWVAVGGLVMGAAVGLVAGGVPARRAARIEPVDALRG